MDKNLNVLLVDRDENSRSIVKAYLSELEGVGIAAEFSDSESVFNLAAESGKCIVLIDTSENLDKAVNEIKTREVLGN